MSDDKNPPTRIWVEDGTSWPHPMSIAGVRWRMRSGKPTKADHLLAAEAIDALLHLYEAPDAARSLPKIRRARRAQVREENAR